MPDQLLSILKYVFLALLYLFFFRVVRAVWAELREPQVDAAPATPAQAHAQAHESAPGGEGPQAPNTASGGAADPPKRQGVHLVLIEPEQRRGQTFDLGEELTIGRAPGCGVSLADDTFVSQLHSRLFRRDGRPYVEDLGSTNGTYLNTREVSAPVELRPGDRLRIGKTVLEVAR